MAKSQQVNLKTRLLKTEIFTFQKPCIRLIINRMATFVKAFCIGDLLFFLAKDTKKRPPQKGGRM